MSKAGSIGFIDILSLNIRFTFADFTFTEVVKYYLTNLSCKKKVLRCYYLQTFEFGSKNESFNFQLFQIDLLFRFN